MIGTPSNLTQTDIRHESVAETLHAICLAGCPTFEFEGGDRFTATAISNAAIGAQEGRAQISKITFTSSGIK